jgi:hypothetical protein
MRGTKLDVNHVGITFRGGKWEARRAERIAQLTFKHVQELAVESPAGVGRSRQVEILAPRPVRVSMGTSDEQIARAAAVEVYRSLLRS